jgi:Transposase DDE domain group 1
MIAPPTLAFPAVGHRTVHASFDGGDLTSDAGLLFLAQADKRLGLTDKMAHTLADRRQIGKVRFDLVTLLKERIYAIAAGYEDCNDLDTLKDDPALRIACGKDLRAPQALASQPTLSRFENAVTAKDLLRLGTLLAQTAIAQLPRDTKHVYLDLDATVDPTHGQQELSLFDGHYDTWCYLPLLAFVTEDNGTQHLIGALLRSACGRSTKGVLWMVRKAVKVLRERFPDLAITVRGDCGFGYGRLINWCRRARVGYLLAVQATNPMRKKALWAQMETAVWHRFKPADFCVYDEFMHQAETWEDPTRMVVKATVDGTKVEVRFVVTHASEGTAEEVYHGYTQRGDAENRIKEFKLDLLSGRTSCHRFLANTFRLLLHQAAAILMKALQLALGATGYAKAQVNTVRVRLLKVAARVVVSCRRIWFHLPTSFPLKELWDTLSTRLWTVST